MVHRTRRPGYTLFELIMVCAVMLIIASVATPSIKSMYGYYKLNGAVDSVRAAWAQARSHAIEEGRPYRFSIEPGGSHYRVAVDQADNSGTSGGHDDKGYVLEEALPTGVHFNMASDSSAPAAPAPAAPPANAPEETARPASGNWAAAAVFLPDGTARDDVKITFQVRGAKPTTILLRGLTGYVSTQNATH